MKSSASLAAWLAVTTALMVYLSSRWLDEAPRAFLPGPTTDAHYQIEERCEVCHTPGKGVKQEACVGCHEAELDRADDSHPASKFIDPRNADRVQRLDALRCVTCHIEHRPAWVSEPAVTMPRDYCVACHHDIAEERPSHRGLSFASCAGAGCHNYHDNRGLTEDFLAAHLDEPALLPRAAVPQRASRTAPPTDDNDDDHHAALAPADADAPAQWSDAPAVAEWAASAHAAAGVNCSDCHGTADSWRARPDQRACRPCHEGEVEQFSASRHGMRIAVGLSPMRVSAARRQMRAGAGERELSCSACHAAHRYDTRRASSEACRDCHDDRHSAACERAPHAALWEREQAGAAAAGTGVSCATCHLPRVEDGGRVRVVHNQNDTLRPNEKMLRPVCGRCHGVGLSLDALADRSLIDRCFAGVPATHVQSLEMVRAKRAKTAP